MAVALAAALIVWVPVGGPVTEYANAAVTLRTGEDFITVTITDPEAEAETFAEAFRAVGLNAEVKKVPWRRRTWETDRPGRVRDVPAGDGA